MSAYTPVLATLGYVLSPDGRSVLLIHRNTRPDDLHYGKYNGLGGKVEAGEDVASAMQREILEEAGIAVAAMALRGTISWPGFGKDGEDWFGFVFRIDRWFGTPSTHNHEGTLAWVAIADLASLNLWEGDQRWLHMVFQEPMRMFHGVMPYRDGRPGSWQCTIL